MERDKRGRFVKKAQTGTQLLPTLKLKNGKQYQLRPGVSTTSAEPWIALAMQDPDKYEMYLESYYEPLYEVPSDVQTENSTITSLNVTTPRKESTFNVNKIVPPNGYYKLDVPSLNLPEIDLLGTNKRQQVLKNQALFGVRNQFTTPKIKYTVQNGKYIDEYGKELNPATLDFNVYERDFSIGSDYGTSSSNVDTKKTNVKSAGMTLTNVGNSGNTSNSVGGNGVIDKTKLADFLEMARAGVGYTINNKIAERALEAEKPFLQDVSESHRTVYGDYRSKVQGEKAAAQLRNMASKPMTSDGALQQQMMLEAQIKGQDYIDKGNAQDEALIRQTREVALQQEKENAQQRQAVAMQNRQAMLMTQKNKTQIENARDSANFSQVLEPLLSGVEQRIRNKGKEQEYYQQQYDSAVISKDVWNTHTAGLSPEQKEMVKIFNTSGVSGIQTYVNGDKNKEAAWLSLKHIMQNEILRRQAALKGVYTYSYSEPSNPYAMWDKGMEFKKGGTIYKARLTKRTKDNDRAAKSIESSKKIAERFLEKALDSLYTYNDVEIIAKPKNKKRKYQAGGGLPFVNFTPVFATSETGAPASTTKESSKDDLTNKDILQLLKDMDGLPADMQVIIQSLQNFELYNVDNGIQSSSDISSRYISLLGKIKMAQFNKNEYNNAFNQLKGNGGLNELAVTSDGLLVGTNQEGDFKYFTAESVKNGEHSESGYQLLTNSNLLYLRANSPEAAFNHQLTTVAQNGIGMPTIDALVSEVVGKLGTNTESSEGYLNTQQGMLIKGLDEFYKAIQASDGKFDGTINDLYKYKYLTKSQAEQAKKAIQYIYQTLPTNAKTLLKVKSDGSDNGALKLIETLISSKISGEQQFDLDLVGGKTHKSSGAGSTKDSSDLKTSLPLNVQKGIGGIDTTITIDRGDGISMNVRGTQYNLIKTPSGQSIADTSLAEMLNSSGLQGIVKDLRGIQFGDQKISPEILSNITYNNTGIVRTNLPVKADGSVNFDLLEQYELAESELEALQDKSKETVQQVYSKYGITELLLPDGSYNQSKFAPFVVTEGYTTDALSGLQTSKFVKEFEGDDDGAAALIQKSLAVGTGKNVQTPDVDTFGWYNPADWFGWTDKIYKGVIYIPITNNVNSAVFGANQTIDYDEALVQEEKYQNFEKRSQQRSTGSDILNI